MSPVDMAVEAFPSRSVSNTDSGNTDSIESDYSCNLEKWDNILDHVLVEWGRDPSSLGDEDFFPPSTQVVGLACELAQYFRDSESPAPSRVVPDGDGGIAFEWDSGELSLALEIDDELNVEGLTFQNHRLVDRVRICIEP